MAEAKLFSLEEADALVPRLQALVAGIQESSRRLRDARTRVMVFVQRHQDEHLDDEGNPDREAYWKAVGDAREAEERMQQQMDEVRFLGAELKDLDLGLVDFRARHGPDTVYLCWRLGEPRIQYWHDLASGFAGRRPIEELDAQRN